jgi:hypothetical protein
MKDGSDAGIHYDFVEMGINHFGMYFGIHFGVYFECISRLV